MDDDEPILLHETNLMLAILRASREGPAGLEAVMARLEANLAAAWEPAPTDRGDLERRLREACRLLEAARALAPAGPDRYRLTARGEGLLAEHPDGVDQSVLGRFAEFRRFLVERTRGTERMGGPRQSGPYQQVGPWQAEPNPVGSHDDPRLDAYTDGMQAYREGKPLDANPYADDSNGHLGWENGWSEARDTDTGAR
jgi:restriction system protein